MAVVDRTVNPRSFGTRPVAAPVGLAGHRPRPRPAVDNLAEGLTKLNAGLGHFLDARQKQSDDQDAARAFDDVQQGRVAELAQVPLDASKAYWNTAHKALGEKSGYEALQKLQGLVAQHGHDPDFDYDAVRQELLASELNGIQDENVLDGFYKVFQTRSESMESAFRQSKTVEAIEKVNETVLSNFRTSARSMVELPPDQRIQHLLENDRTFIEESRGMPGMSMSQVNEQRISAITDVAMETGDMGVFQIFDASDPSGAPLRDHPVHGDAIVRAQAQVAKVLKARDTAGNFVQDSLKIDAFKKAVDTAGTFSNELEVLEAAFEAGFTTAKSAQPHVEAWRKTEEKEVHIQGLLDVVKTGGVVADPKDLTDVWSRMRTSLQDAGISEDEIETTEAAFYARNGKVSSEFQEDVSAQIRSNTPENVIKGLTRMAKLRHQSPHVLNTLNESTVNAYEYYRALEAADIGTEEAVALVAEGRGKEFLSARKTTIAQLHSRSPDAKKVQTVLNSILDDFGFDGSFFGSRPQYGNRPEVEKRFQNLTASLFTTNRFNTLEDAAKVAATAMKENMTIVPGADGNVVVDRRDIPPFYVDPDFNEHLRQTLIPSVLDSMGIAHDAEGPVGNEMQRPGVTEFTPSDRREAEIEINEVIMFPVNKQHAVLMDGETGQFIARVDVSKAVDDWHLQRATDASIAAEAAALEHERILQEAAQNRKAQAGTSLREGAPLPSTHR